MTDDVINERLTPGPDCGDDSKNWKPNGKCEGVFYLDEYKVSTPHPSDNTTLVESIIIPSNEREANRYLKPASEMFFKKHPGQSGRCVPNVGFLVPRELSEYAKTLEVAVRWMFNSDYTCCIEANQPTHAGKWIIKKVNDGIYVAIYDGEPK